MSDILKKTAKLLTYTPLQQPGRYQVDENKEVENLPISEAEKLQFQLSLLVKTSQHLSQCLEKTIASLRKNDFTALAPAFREELQNIDGEFQELLQLIPRSELDKKIVSASLAHNIATLQKLYRSAKNTNLTIREIKIPGTTPLKAAVAYIGVLVDKKMLTVSVLRPLMAVGLSKQEIGKDKVLEVITKTVLTNSNVANANSFAEIQKNLNAGKAILFVEGVEEVLVIEVAGIPHRSPEKPTIEQSIRGSQVSFTEHLETNLSLLQSFLKTNDLITEKFEVGSIGKTACAVVYLQSIANHSIVAEVKRRMRQIETDLIINTGVLEEYITDSPLNPFPSSLATQRPDRAAVHLTKGNIAILLEGDPFVLVIPVSFFSLLHSPDDYSVGILYGNFIRVTRILSIMITALLPGVYLSLSLFHSEALPTDLILAISSARLEVPFPTIIEIFLMEFSFELIRESGIRSPGFLGPTVGVVGALILGQAAVAAKVVSPIMVIIVSITGLASFTIPDHRLANTIRILRFGFMLLGATSGLVGITCGILVCLSILTNLKSYGVPYLAPVAPKVATSEEAILRKPAYKSDFRPDELNSKDPRRQPLISRKWLKTKQRDGDIK